MSGLDSFRLAPLAATAVAGGLVADILVSSGRSPRVVAAVTAVALWVPYFAVLQLHYHLGWEVHLWAGTVFLAVLSGAGLSLLAFLPPVPDAVPTAAAMDEAGLPERPTRRAAPAA